MDLIYWLGGARIVPVATQIASNLHTHQLSPCGNHDNCHLLCLTKGETRHQLAVATQILPQVPGAFGMGPGYAVVTFQITLKFGRRGLKLCRASAKMAKVRMTLESLQNPP
jgi:outer membrane receptor for Fe3+-dicitrate